MDTKLPDAITEKLADDAIAATKTLTGRVMPVEDIVPFILGYGVGANKAARMIYPVTKQLYEALIYAVNADIVNPDPTDVEASVKKKEFSKRITKAFMEYDKLMQPTPTKENGKDQTNQSNTDKI